MKKYSCIPDFLRKLGFCSCIGNYKPQKTLKAQKKTTKK